MLADDVRHFLRRHGIRLERNLGQHFLIDESVLQTIVDTAAITPSDRILEIGPGIGILTRELLHKGADVTTIELDQRLIPLLKKFCSSIDLSIVNCQLSIVHANALHATINIKTPFAVVANIPYAITSPLLRRLLLELPHRPASLTLLIQREVAETICAATSEGILPVLVRLFGEPRIVRHVPKECFLPPPDVESSILHIRCFEEPLVDRERTQKILKLVKHAMSGRRKMLRNTVGALPRGLEGLAAAGVDPERRPQTLRVEEWIQLAKAMDVILSGVEG